jgi:carboxymethylenebutenolidase
MTATVAGHVAENDGMFSPDMVEQLRQRLEAAGVQATFTNHPGTDHAFFNDTRPEVYNAEAAAAAWASTLEFLGDTVR